jgi:hypothetical protein
VSFGRSAFAPSASASRGPAASMDGSFPLCSGLAAIAGSSLIGRHARVHQVDRRETALPVQPLLEGSSRPYARSSPTACRSPPQPRQPVRSPGRAATSGREKCTSGLRSAWGQAGGGRRNTSKTPRHFKAHQRSTRCLQVSSSCRSAVASLERSEIRAMQRLPGSTALLHSAFATR